MQAYGFSEPSGRNNIAGIGGVGAVVINGGVVSATGGNSNAGIGGVGADARNMRVTINGGRVDAEGGFEGVGIGGGVITINGGIVTVRGQVGIGSMPGGVDRSDITIDFGVVGVGGFGFDRLWRAGAGPGATVPWLPSRVRQLGVSRPWISILGRSCV
ncbi:MAG: hypothetical protein LBJ44_05055 [Propionibacteriaceae bacterium]|nr:hypothetical protein [Propionibacteriaceae bacterium]